MSDSDRRTTVATILSLALIRAGVDVVTYVPGLGATDIFQEWATATGREPLLSFHEEVALGVALGAALAGKRAVAIMKAHGLAKAANAAIDALYSGTVAGFVVIVVDDRTGIQSDCIMDTAALLDGLGWSCILGNPDGRIGATLTECLLRSEREGLPQALVVDASEVGLLAENASPAIVPVVPPPSCPERDPTRTVLCPPFGRYQQAVLEAKRDGRDWRNLPRPEVRSIPEALPPHWRPLADRYAPLFRVLMEFRGRIVTGDTGLSTMFALPPYGVIDLTTYMGGSLPLAIGAYLAGVRPAWAVTGDFSFIAAGHLGLIEALNRDIPLKILILANHQAQTTGGQAIPPGCLERILAGYQEFVSRIDTPENETRIRQVLAEAAGADHIRLIVVEYPRKD